MVAVNAVPFCERDWSICRFSINKSVLEKQCAIDTKKMTLCGRMVPKVLACHYLDWKKKVIIL